MQEEILLELFSIPIGLKKIIKVDEVELYSSNSLAKKFKEAVAETQTLSPFSEKINELIDREKLIPCYINRRITKVFLWKLLSRGETHEYGSSLAFYNTKSKKIYILIDNSISYSGFISNEVLGKLIMHECIHMAAFTDWIAFGKLFSKELVSFYSHYFKYLFKLDDISEKEVRNYVFDIMKIRKDGVNVDMKSYFDRTKLFLDYLKKQFKKLPEEFDKIASNYIYICKIAVYGKRDINFVNELVKKKEIITPFFKAYTKAFGMKADSLPFQEIYEPSEVICIYSEQTSSKEKVLKMFSLIK